MVVEVVEEDSVTSLMTSRMWAAVWVAGEGGRGPKGKGEEGGDTSDVSEKRRLVRLLLLVAGEIVTETGRHFYIAFCSYRVRPGGSVATSWSPPVSSLPAPTLS